MKTSLLTILLFFSCLSFTLAQKQYGAKVIMLDNKVVKGLFYHVDDQGIYILPNNVRWDFKNDENNKPQMRFIDYRSIKQVNIRRRGSVGIGFLLGLGTSIIVGKAVSDKQKNSLTGLAMFFVILPIGPLTGGIIGSSSKKFDVKKDSDSIQNLETKLQKYAWYHAKGSIESEITNDK
jgi:hypothetical protein